MIPPGGIGFDRYRETVMETSASLLERLRTSPDDATWRRLDDLYRLSRLMELITPLFELATLAAFRRVAVEGASPAQAADELGLSLNAVLLAKSRVLSRLRQEAKGLID